MTKAVVTALIAVVLGLTVSPADARPLHGKNAAHEFRAPCGRIQIVSGEPGDCTVRFCKARKHKHRHDSGEVRKHRHQRHCLTPFPISVP